MRSLAATLLAALLGVGPVMAQDFRPPPVDGRTNVRDNDMKPVFLREQLFFPGETVKLQVEYRVDAMRRMHEDRECWSKWFGGIDCHYVKRSDSAGLDAARVPLVLDLAQPNGAGAPQVTPKLENGSAYDPFRQLPIGTSAFTLTITVPQLDTILGEGYFLEGRVAPRYGLPGSFGELTRQPCDPFRDGQYCSQGEYVITLASVDASQRLEMIERWLRKARGAVEIAASIDDWTIFKFAGDGRLVVDSAARIRLAKALLDQANKFHTIPAGGAPRSDRLPILTLARRLDGANPSISSAIVATQIANGNIRDAETENNQKIADYQRQYQALSYTEPVLRGYAEALRDAGRIYLARSFQLNPADTLVAVDYFKQSAQIWSEYIEKAPGADIAHGTEQFVEARLDEARTGARISDLVSLDEGIKALRDARTRVPLVREGLVVGVEQDGAMLVAADHFTALTQVGNANLALTMLPADVLEVLDIDSLGGRALLVEKGRAGLVDFGIAKGGGHIVTRWLEHAKLTLGGIVGEDAGSLIREADGMETVLTSLAAGRLWEAASGADVVVVVASDGKSPPTAIRSGTASALDPLPLYNVSALALSRDGGLLAVEGIANGERTLLLVDLTSGKLQRTVKLPANGAGERLMFTSVAQRVIVWRKDKVLEIVHVATGDVAILKDTDSVRAPAILSNNRLLLARGASSDPIHYISVIDTDKVTTGPANAQADGAVTGAELAQELEAPALVALYRDPNAPQPTLAATALGTAASPVMVRLNAATGARGEDIALTDWHPLRSFPVGTLIAVNPGARGGSARLFSPDGSDPVEFAAGAGKSTRIVPIGTGTGFAVVIETAEGSVARVEVYSGPGRSVKAVDLDQQLGRKWRSLAITMGPLIARRQRLLLIELPQTPSSAAVATRLAAIGADGSYWSATQSIAAPHEVVAFMGKGSALVRQTAAKLALEASDGNSTNLADCTSKPNCTLAVYQVAPTKLVSSLEMNDKLELEEWTVGDSIASVSCKACSQLDPIAAAATIAARPIGFPSTRFTLSLSGGVTYVAFPGNRSLLSGPLPDEPSGSRAAGGMPVYSNQEQIAAQTGSNVELWKRTKP